MPKPTLIPVDEDSCYWLMVAVRFEYFSGDCSINITNLDWAPDRPWTVRSTCVGDRTQCADFEREVEMLNGRLTYSVRVLAEGMADPLVH